MSTPDWARIKTEYIAKGTPYRKLCQQFGVNERTLCRHAKEENWAALRRESVSKVQKQCQQNAESAVIRQASRLTLASEKLLKKAEQLLDLEEPLSPRDLKALSATLLDARTLLGVKDEDDHREQRLRIDKMHMEVEAMKAAKAEGNKLEVVWVANEWDEVQDETGTEQTV